MKNILQNIELDKEDNQTYILRIIINILIIVGLYILDQFNSNC